MQLLRRRQIPHLLYTGFERAMIFFRPISARLNSLAAFLLHL